MFDLHKICFNIDAEMELHKIPVAPAIYDVARTRERPESEDNGTHRLQHVADIVRVKLLAVCVVSITLSSHSLVYCISDSPCLP